MKKTVNDFWRRCILACIGLLPLYVFAQSGITVRGSVSDTRKEPVIGATVIVKGNVNQGTITDMDGRYELRDVPSGATLVFSYIGTKTQEIAVEGRSTIDVILSEDDQLLDEVVVVGYGTQKKVNLTGSVASINMNELTESRPITNTSHALAGMVAGVSVRSGKNQPGDDNAGILVRGQGTLNSSAPLIIIDGVEAGINTVNPQDIESMSVLKDAASASIYGSRAANGVVLITTKQGKEGDVKIDYNGYISSESIRKTLTPVSNYADYMELVNEGWKNSGKSRVFSDKSIKAWRDDAGRNPLKYPNTDWVDETFRPSVSTNHTLSVSGGSKNMRYYGSFGYLDNPGVMENAGFTRYNARLNLDANLKSWLKIGMQLSGYVSNMGPAAGSVVKDVFTYTSATTPGMVFRSPDGRYGAMNNLEDASQSANNNPLRRLNSVSGNTRKNNMRTRFFGVLNPFKGFTITGSYSYEFVDLFQDRKPVFLDGWNFTDNTVTLPGAGKTSITNVSDKIERFFNDLVANYETSLFDSRMNLKAMVGASQELYREKKFSARRYNLIDPNLDVIDGAVGESSSSGSRTEWVMHSHFGRLNLDWDNKYLLEINLRTDASSRFAKNKRRGYFPSVSGAWRVDQEAFMAPLTEKGLSNLKLRASYGSLGNNSVGNYDALSTYSNIFHNHKLGYVLNNTAMTALAQPAIANPDLSWESTYVTDFGIDFGLAGNRLTGTIDYFDKKTKNILINLPAPAVHGTVSIPKQNSAQVTNRGIEITLGWRDRIGDFSYSAEVNFTHITNNVDKFKGKEYSLSGTNMIKEGLPINAQYMLRVDRIIQTDEDLALVQKMIDNAPIVNGKKVNPFAAYGRPQKGDLLYKDINGDGVIDEKDRTVVSDGPNPKYHFGLNLGASYKGIDFSVLLQGQAGVKVYWQHSPYNTPTVRTGYQINKAIADGRWYEGRTDATYPRLLDYSDRRNTIASDFYLEDKAFLKIRNIQLGYTFPKSLTQKVRIERIRLYGSLENFFTFTKYKGFDPEVSGLNYPSMKQAVAGINLSF